MTASSRLLLTLLGLMAACGAACASSVRPADGGLGSVDAAIDTATDVVPTDTPDSSAGPARLVCPAPIILDQFGSAPVRVRQDGGSPGDISLSSGTWTLLRGDPLGIAFPAAGAEGNVRAHSPGEYDIHYVTFGPGRQLVSCSTRVIVRSVVELLCRSEVTGFVGDNVVLSAFVRAADPSMYRVNGIVVAAPSGPTPRNLVPGADLTLHLDQLGLWRVRLTAIHQGSPQASASCDIVVRAVPSIELACPANALSARPLTTERFGVRASSRRGRLLTVAWSIVAAPYTSTAPIVPDPDTRSASMFIDSAGVWTVRATARDDQGEQATCTFVILSAPREDVRVELAWNRDVRQPWAVPPPDQVNLDLHLAQQSGSRLSWAQSNPLDCYSATCACIGIVDGRCVGARIDWPPLGPINNPTLDLDQNGIRTPGPENINIVQLVGPHRLAVGVHWYGCETCDADYVRSTRAVVRAHCRGRIIFESEVVQLSPGPSATGPRDHSAFEMWHVGWIIANESECRFERCGEVGNLGACVRPLRDFR